MNSPLSLPDDILLMIISHFSLDGYNIDIARPTLCALSLVSHRLYHLATSCLYRDIYIARSHQDGASYIYDPLLRSVNGNAKLGAKVQSLFLSWDHSLRGRNPQELFTRLVNLRNLRLVSGRDDVKLDHRLYIPPPATACYYELELQVSKPSRQEIPDLLIQCRVHDLKLTVVGLSNLEFITPAPSDQARRATLQSFDFDPTYSSISLKALGNLLSYPASLLRLVIPLPGLVMEVDEYDFFLGRPRFRYPLSPKALLHALSSTFESLESLNIIGGTLFSDHDGSKFSMMSFQKLKVAKVPAELFFSKRSRCTHFDELLPRSLVSLTIIFDSYGHIPLSLSWLSSLASHKPSLTPSLAHVKIAEHSYGEIGCGTSMNPMGGHFEYDETTEQDVFVADPDFCPPVPKYWKPPAWLREEFERENVELEMEVWDHMGQTMSGEEEVPGDS